MVHPTRVESNSKNILETIYYDAKHPAGYSTPNILYKHAKKHGVTRKQVREFLLSEDSYTLHKQTRRGRRNRIVVNDIDEQWELDLSDLPAITTFNDGYRYILCCIDVLSKYAWVLSLKRKTGPVLLEAIKKIITESGRKPKRIRVDKGGEFVNHHVKDYCKAEGIQFILAQNETKAAIVERFQKTLKGYMWRYFTKTGNRRYIDKLQDFAFGYNHRIHRSIKHRPVDVNEGNAHIIREILYGKKSNNRHKTSYRFKVGDSVRISKLKGVFQKGYEANWSDEIFTVSRRYARDPPVYSLQDSQKETLTGTFYEFELQKVTPPEYYVIEEIIKERGRGDKKEYYVKWKGYPTSANSWIKSSDLKV